MSILEELTWRGLVHEASEGVAEHLAAGPVHLYIGFDPTSDSLHVGSLLQILSLMRMQRAGHHPIALVGGGTGLIGDPSGKTAERQLLTSAQVEHNLAGIRRVLERFLDFETTGNPARMVDNGEWLCTIPFVDFLRDVGKHFTVNYLLAKESVKRRIESEGGISFTEFSYLLLQSYDFLELFDRTGCTLQMGGSDQWGNITGGMELIRRLRGAKAHGIVSPLVTNAAGTKFGKTESGTIWLDADRTSPYRFYQFWLNTSDADIGRYLRYFTFLERSEIEALERAHEEAPQERTAHRRLAAEVTAMVHGPEALARAERSAAVLFGGDLEGVAADDLLEIFADVPSHEVTRDRVAGEGLAAVELFAESGLAASKGAARRLVRDGGAYVDGVRIGDEQHRVRRADFREDRILVLRAGRKKYCLVTLAGDGS